MSKLYWYGIRLFVCVCVIACVFYIAWGKKIALGTGANINDSVEGVNISNIRNK